MSDDLTERFKAAVDRPLDHALFVGARPGRDAYQSGYHAGWRAAIDAAAEAIVGMCHNGHPFEPGIDVDMRAEGREPDPRWCNICGDTRGWFVGPSTEAPK